MNAASLMGYLVAAVFFCAGLRMLAHVPTARRGNQISAVGMVIAIVVAMVSSDVLSWTWIVLALAVGGIGGILAAKRIRMTAIPNLVAIFNGTGALSSLLITLVIWTSGILLSSVQEFAAHLAVVIGVLTVAGSVVAWGKLSGTFPEGSQAFGGQKWVAAITALAILVLAALSWFGWVSGWGIPIGLIGLSAILALLLASPVSSADMPVGVALLNSFSGISVCATGFVLENPLVVMVGALMGTSGLILATVMCKAMNRSISSVFLSGYNVVTGVAATIACEVSPISIQDLYYLLESAKRVVIVPGYGLAVAQAQHALKELGDILEANGTEVLYAIHPVAGRMPGHMNVLLAEAAIPYDHLVEMDDINRQMDTVDVGIVIGANDVVNPGALDDTDCPIYGMSIIEIHRCRSVIVLKRSMAAGYSGIQNPLFCNTNTRMLFGDAKASLQGMAGEFR